MDSFEWNKVFGALLGLAFVVMGVNFLSDAIFHHKSSDKFEFAIEGGEAIAATGPAASGPTEESVNALLASADLAKGEKVGKKCLACHNFNEGGANKVGPALYDIVNQPFGNGAGFAESYPK